MSGQSSRWLKERYDRDKGGGRRSGSGSGSGSGKTRSAGPRGPTGAAGGGRPLRNGHPVVGPEAPALKYDILTGLGLAGIGGAEALERRLAQRMYVLITARFDWFTGTFCVGQPQLASMWSVTVRSVGRTLREFRERGWIEIAVPAAKGRVAEYRINLATVAAWTEPYWERVGPDYVDRMRMTAPAGHGNGYGQGAGGDSLCGAAGTGGPGPGQGPDSAGTGLGAGALRDGDSDGVGVGVGVGVEDADAAGLAGMSGEESKVVPLHGRRADDASASLENVDSSGFESGRQDSHDTHDAHNADRAGEVAGARTKTSTGPQAGRNPSSVSVSVSVSNSTRNPASNSRSMSNMGAAQSRGLGGAGDAREDISHAPELGEDGTAWPAIAVRLHALDAKRFDTWFRGVEAESQIDGVLRLCARDSFRARYVSQNYESEILAIAEAIKARLKAVEVVGPER